MTDHSTSPPHLDIPESQVSVTVRILDTGARASVAAAVFLDPVILGHELLANSPAYPFLIEHESGFKVLFDLGFRKDWQNYAPTLLKMFDSASITIEAEKDVVDVLEEGGVRKEEINAVIWRHVGPSLVVVWLTSMQQSLVFRSRRRYLTIRPPH
jgi:hypothetical protein